MNAPRKVIAAPIDKKDRSDIIDILVAFAEHIIKVHGSKPEHFSPRDIVTIGMWLGGTVPARYADYAQAIKKRELFNNGSKNSYDSPWWTMTDAQQITIGKEVVKRLQKSIKASTSDTLPFSQRHKLMADASTGKAAGAVLFCPSTGRCLWVKRSDTGDAPNVWCCLGGGVDAGETIMQGLRRELMEEGGIEHRFPIHPFYRFDADDGQFSYYNCVGIVDEEFEPTLNHEHTEFRWSEEIPTPCHPNLEKALRDPRFRELVDKYRAIRMEAAASPSYEAAKAIKQEAEAEVQRRSAVLQKLSKDRGPTGLVPDAVRNTPEYQMAKHAFDQAMRKQAEVNKWFLKNYKKEYALDRQNKYKTKASADEVKVGDKIQFASDAETDKGPCSGTVAALKLTADGLIATLKVSDGQLTRAWDDLDAVRAKNGIWIVAAVKSPEAVFSIRNEDILALKAPSDGKTFGEREPREQFDWLNKLSLLVGTGVGKVKIGNGTFADRVSFNSLYKDGSSKWNVVVGKRRGYMAVTFTLSK